MILDEKLSERSDKIASEILFRYKEDEAVAVIAACSKVIDSVSSRVLEKYNLLEQADRLSNWFIIEATKFIQLGYTSSQVLYAAESAVAACCKPIMKKE